MYVQHQILNTDQTGHSDNTERNDKICLEQYDFKSFCGVQLLFYERVYIPVRFGRTFSQPKCNEKNTAMLKN